jgi:hypothetical protein
MLFETIAEEQNTPTKTYILQTFQTRDKLLMPKNVHRNNLPPLLLCQNQDQHYVYYPYSEINTTYSPR